MIRDILHAFGRWLIELPLELLSLIVVPVACLFVRPGADGKNRLPAWAGWWDEYDYGVDGDGGWQGPSHANGHQSEYKWRVLWLWRNRVNTFSKLVQGFPSSDVVSLRYEGDVKTSNRPGCSGFLKIEATLKDGRRRFEYYYVRQWWNTSVCTRIRIGWKLKDVLDEYLRDGVLGNDPEVREYMQFVFSPSPWMSFDKG